MKRKEILRWRAHTRKYLLVPAIVREIEAILRSLTPDFLDAILYEEANELPPEKRNNLDLRHEGELLNCILRERHRPKPMWGYLDQLLRESGRETCPIGESLGVSFETKNRQRNVILGTFDRPLIPRPDNEYVLGNHLAFDSEDHGLSHEDRDSLAWCLPTSFQQRSFRLGILLSRR